MSRIVQQGGGTKANLHLIVLPDLPQVASILNAAKGRCEFRTVLGNLYFHETDRAAVAAYFASLAKDLEVPS